MATRAQIRVLFGELTKENKLTLVCKKIMNGTYFYSSIVRNAFAGFATALSMLCTMVIAEPASAGYASIIINAENGQTLLATNADTRNYPASLAKMMTLFMVFETLNTGKWTLDTELKVSARAARQPASRLGLKRGEIITVKNAILALVTKSANDVATVVAENIAGSERNFALIMTSMARQLDMTRTTFRNGSGLPHRGQMSTARDMAKLARALLLRHRQYYHFFSTRTFRYAGRIYKNHNKLLANYKGADGIKTGYIRASGYNLVASVKRGRTRLIGVVFGGRNSRQRNRIMTKLLNKAFKITDRSINTAVATSTSAPRKKPVSSDARSKNTTARSAWGVQVGAYKNYSQAYRSAQSAVKIAKRYLGSGTIKVIPLKTRRGKTLYRARIHGLTKKKAYGTCRELERKSRDCMELRVKYLRLAANTH